jgi:tetratricopeptide (TPR) repeat protein
MPERDGIKCPRASEDARQVVTAAPRIVFVPVAQLAHGGEFAYTFRQRGGAMKYRAACGVALLLSCTLTLTAQRTTGTGGSGTTGTTPGRGTTSNPGTTVPNLSLPNPSEPTTLYIIGKVIVDDGSVLSEPAAVQTNCKGRKRTIGHTDQKGGFSFQLTSGPQGAYTGISDAIDSESSSTTQQDSRRNGMSIWRDCEINADLPGFTSQVVDLASKMNGGLQTDVGNIVIHRIGKVDGFTISATSANAPPQARKAFEKGRSLEKKQKWNEAQQKFQSAVDAYPKYAEAWVELGRVQLKQNAGDEAVQSFQHALLADPKLISPYQELAELAAKKRQWQELADLSDQLLQLNPINYPQFWYLNGVANYNLQRFENAHRSASRGLALDGSHRLPRLDFLAGQSCARLHDYKGAQEHIRNYLRFAGDDPDAEIARQQLKELEKIQANSDSPDHD